jgi:hypothetical protein
MVRSTCINSYCLCAGYCTYRARGGAVIVSREAILLVFIQRSLCVDAPSSAPCVRHPYMYMYMCVCAWWRTIIMYHSYTHDGVYYMYHNYTSRVPCVRQPYVLDSVYECVIIIYVLRCMLYWPAHVHMHVHVHVHVCTCGLCIHTYYHCYYATPYVLICMWCSRCSIITLLCMSESDTWHCTYARIKKSERLWAELSFFNYNVTCMC